MVGMGLVGRCLRKMTTEGVLPSVMVPMAAWSSKTALTMACRHMHGTASTYPRRWKAAFWSTGRLQHRQRQPWPSELQVAGHEYDGMRLVGWCLRQMTTEGVLLSVVVAKAAWSSKTALTLACRNMRGTAISNPLRWKAAFWSTGRRQHRQRRPWPVGLQMASHERENMGLMG